MKKYAEQLKALQSAILESDQVFLVPEIKETRPLFTAEQRLAVYAGGYMQRLAEAVHADYPALAQYIGKEKFQHAVNAFITHTPSTGWDFNQYPARFAEFMQRYHADEAATSLALLEGAISEIFWQPEAGTLDAAMLAALPEEALSQCYFTFSPTVRLLSLTHDAHHYLTAFRNGQQATMPAQSCYIMVIRFQREVHRMVIEPLEYTVLQHLKQGCSFEEALTNTGNAAILTQKLPEYIENWLRLGVFSSVH